jgi:protein gp37
MGDRTAISWTEATWNPVTGCTEVSEGCDHCYARSVAHRFAGTPAYPWGFEVTLRPERLDQPLRWRRPRMIFVNSMSDLFHAEIPDGMIAQVFAVMALATSHTFQVLTKRPGRMRSLLTSPDFRWQVWHQMLTLTHDRSMPMPAEHATALAWPLSNVWMGVSVETQKWADVRIPILLATPARVRFLSMEPLLAPVTLSSWTLLTPQLHWVIVGGESGPGSRRMDPSWAVDLAEECRCAGIAFFMKQTGTVLAREWGIPGKGDDPTRWPSPLPQQLPGSAA